MAALMIFSLLHPLLHILRKIPSCLNSLFPPSQLILIHILLEVITLALQSLLLINDNVIQLLLREEIEIRKLIQNSIIQNSVTKNIFLELEFTCPNVVRLKSKLGCWP